MHGLSGLLNLVTFGLIGESGHTHTEIVTISGIVPATDLDRTAFVSGLNQPTDSGSCLKRQPQGDPDRILIDRKGRHGQRGSTTG